jgi:hypothetical protein
MFVGDGLPGNRQKEKTVKVVRRVELPEGSTNLVTLRRVSRLSIYFTHSTELELTHALADLKMNLYSSESRSEVSDSEVSKQTHNLTHVDGQTQVSEFE